jgi:ferritin-like metal-binding protein YciE
MKEEWPPAVQSPIFFWESTVIQTFAQTYRPAVCNTFLLNIKPMDSSKTINKTELDKLFIHQLNRVNCTKGYLARHLPPLAEVASFKNMKLAIMEAHGDVKKQQSRIDDMYKLMHSEPSDEGCEVVKAVLDEASNLGDGKGKSAIINDMDIILYMRMIENMELTSFRMLKLINQYMGNDQLTQLLAECSDENADNEELFSMISEEYLTQKILQ